MARSLRSNRSQINKTILRKKVFNPVEHARAERLSAKLLELAQQPKPERTEMEVEKTSTEERPTEAINEEQMEDVEVEDEGWCYPFSQLHEHLHIQRALHVPFQHGAY